MYRQLQVGCIAASILLLTTYLGVQAKPDKKDGKRDTPNYYPLEVGNTWHYKLTVNGIEKKMTSFIAKHESIDGKTQARLEIRELASTEHLVQSDKGVFRHRYNGTEVTPAFQLLPYPAKVGMKWKGDFKTQDEKASYDGEIQAEEAVEVPAGKFKTLKVHFKLKTNGQLIETTYWLAVDVGIVKQTFNLGPDFSFLSELEKFERKK